MKILQKIKKTLKNIKRWIRKNIKITKNDFKGTNINNLDFSEHVEKIIKLVHKNNKENKL